MSADISRCLNDVEQAISRGELEALLKTQIAQYVTPCFDELTAAVLKQAKSVVLLDGVPQFFRDAAML